MLRVKSTPIMAKINGIPYFGQTIRGSENEHGIRIDPKRNSLGSVLDQRFYRYEDDFKFSLSRVYENQRASILNY
jgi:hypothetical protein